MVWVWGRLLLLLLALLAFRVYGQLDSSGFISIDCGLPARSTIIETVTKLTYVSDEQFIDTGVNFKINSQYINDDLRKELVTVRSFPEGARNCYALKSKAGSKYLLRAVFKYGNYDNLNKPPIFDIYLGGNIWDTVNITAEVDFYITEIITVANADNLQVCLINKNQGTPFISWLDLRPLDLSTYQFANSTQSLVYVLRLNLGANASLIRYPYDPYDRFWYNGTEYTWTAVSTGSTVEPDKDFATPSLVMQTAATSSSTKESIDIYWRTTVKSIMYYGVIHIAEIQSIVSPDRRVFDIYANGELLWKSNVLDTLHTGSATFISAGHTDHNMSLVANSKSTLPPMLNAFELYMVVPAGGVTTYDGDVSALNAIKENYKVNNGWSGDPCVPSEYTWTGVTCTSDSSNIPRITGLNLSACGLTGIVVSSFGNLSALKSLDLSGNDLSGFLPTVLDDLSAVTYLDLSGNSKISTTLPPGLQKKQQDGTLTYKYDFRLLEWLKITHYLLL